MFRKIFCRPRKFNPANFSEFHHPRKFNLVGFKKYARSPWGGGGGGVQKQTSIDLISFFGLKANMGDV